MEEEEEEEEEDDDEDDEDDEDVQLVSYSQGKDNRRDTLSNPLRLKKNYQDKLKHFVFVSQQW